MKTWNNNDHHHDQCGYQADYIIICSSKMHEGCLYCEFNAAIFNNKELFLYDR